MRRVIPLTLAGIVTFSLLLWNILTTSPIGHPQLSILLPSVLGLTLFSWLMFIRLSFARNNNGQSTLKTLIRQNLLIAILSGSLLYLQGLRVLTLIDAILLIAATVLLELFFMSEKTDVRTPKDD
ncbi:MAG: hypothetical protein Q7S64_00935 [bacterium]|nr:hypothetical protein [bacterium]